jgi:tetratricopeptide (TPR) repeat protein
MFFPRLRRHAKWMFVFLAVVFGVGFVAFGVGAGGVGFGDVLKDIGGGSGPSISKAQEETDKHPKDPAAWQALSEAMQAEGDTAGAVEAQRQLVALRPKDLDALRVLAQLQISLVADKQTQAQIIQSNAALEAPGQNFPSLTIDGQKLLDDPVGTAVNAKASLEIQRLIGEAQAAAAGAVEAYKKIVAVQPNDPGVQLELAQVAQQTGDTATAIAAYRRFLVLAPDDPNASAVKQQLNQLVAGQSGSS